MRVQSLGHEDPLEKEMVTHTSILAWRIPWTVEPGQLQSIGSHGVGHDLKQFSTHARAARSTPTTSLKAASLGVPWLPSG